MLCVVASVISDLALGSEIHYGHLVPYKLALIEDARVFRIDIRPISSMNKNIETLRRSEMAIASKNLIINFCQEWLHRVKSFGLPIDTAITADIPVLSRENYISNEYIAADLLIQFCENIGDIPPDRNLLDDKPDSSRGQVTKIFDVSLNSKAYGFGNPIIYDLTFVPERNPEVKANVWPVFNLETLRGKGAVSFGSGAKLICGAKQA